MSVCRGYNSSSVPDSGQRQSPVKLALPPHDLLAMSLDRFVAVPLPGQGSLVVGHRPGADLWLS